jgi:DNA polymerase V
VDKSWGGKRTGAGRPKGIGKFGEKTKPMRVPISRLSEVMNLLNSASYQIPLYSSKVEAGFPSPAEDYVDRRLDLNDYLVKNPAATFFVRVSGLSMVKAGINPDDILVVDRSVEATNGKIVIAVVGGELTVKRLYKDKKQILLLPENDDFSPINISERDDVMIWGVVKSVIHSF